MVRPPSSKGWLGIRTLFQCPLQTTPPSFLPLFRPIPQFCSEQGGGKVSPAWEFQPGFCPFNLQT